MVENVPNINFPSGVDGIQANTPIALSYVNLLLASSLAPSNDKEAHQMIEMSTPYLQNQGWDPLSTHATEVATMIALMESKIATEVTTAWVKSTQEIAADQKEQLHHKVMSGLDSYSILVAEQLQQMYAQMAGMASPVQHAAAPGGIPGVSGVGQMAETTSIAGAAGAASAEQFAAPAGSSAVPVVNPSLSGPMLPPPVAAAAAEQVDNSQSPLPKVAATGLTTVLMMQMAIPNIALPSGMLEGTTSILSLSGTELYSNLAAQMATAQLTPVDMSSAIAMVAALFGTTLLVTSALQTVGKNKGANEQFNQKFAQENIKQTLSMVNSPEFEHFVKNLIIAPIEIQKGPLSFQAQQNILASMKLVYLLGALAVYYKAETGQLTSEEILGLLNGEIKLEADDPRLQVIEQINVIKQQLKGEAGIKFWSSALAYFDSNPKIHDLLDPVNLFKILAEPDDWDTKQVKLETFAAAAA